MGGVLAFVAFAGMVCGCTDLQRDQAGKQLDTLAAKVDALAIKAAATTQAVTPAIKAAENFGVPYAHYADLAIGGVSLLAGWWLKRRQIAPVVTAFLETVTGLESIEKSSVLKAALDIAQSPASKIIIDAIKAKFPKTPELPRK